MVNPQKFKIMIQILPRNLVVNKHIILQTKAWVAERRPEVMDYMTDYWRGGPVYPEDMEE